MGYKTNNSNSATISFITANQAICPDHLRRDKKGSPKKIPPYVESLFKGSAL